MQQPIIAQKFMVGDQAFNTRAEAADSIRLPQVRAALNQINGNNTKLTEFLIEHQEAIEMAFEAGTLRRVTKSERNQLAKALEEVKALAVDNPKLKFLETHAASLVETFRWPTVKRMTDEEKATAARNTLLAATDDEGVVTWILSNKTAVLEAFKAGVVKREVSSKAAEALAAYRAKKAAEKAAAEEAAAEEA